MKLITWNPRHRGKQGRIHIHKNKLKPCVEIQTKMWASYYLLIIIAADKQDHIVLLHLFLSRPLCVWTGAEDTAEDCLLSTENGNSILEQGTNREQVYADSVQYPVQLHMSHTLNAGTDHMYVAPHTMACQPT